MSKDILSYYNAELDYVRKAGVEFAAAHPKIAGNLRMDQHAIEDPMVARLVESFAFLNAKLSKQLDDGYNVLAENLLANIYPHANLPIPSIATVQLQPTELDKTEQVVRGTYLTSDMIEGDAEVTCKFQTCYDLDVLPLMVSDANYIVKNTLGYDKHLPAAVKSGIDIKFKLLSEQLELGTVNKLRFYINSSKQYASSIYAAIFNAVKAVTFFAPESKQAVTLNSSCLKLVGFAEDEALLPYPNKSFAGYRTLTEFSAYAEKFMYFEIDGCADALQQIAAEEFSIILAFNENMSELKPAISKDTFQLNCTPIINIFAATSETIKVDHAESTYLLSADKRYTPWSTEIYQINSLTGYSERGLDMNLQPIFNYSYATTNSWQDRTIYWQAVRKPSWHYGAQNDFGSEIELTFIDADAKLDGDVWSITADCLFTNRDLPLSLSSTNNDIDFAIEHPVQELVAIKTLRRPTATIRPKTEKAKYWQLVNALVGAQSTLTDPDVGLDNLRGILQTFNLLNSAEWNLFLEQMQGINVATTAIRNPEAKMLSFVHGIKYQISFSNNLQLADLYLFGTILSYFLNEYCAIDSLILLEFIQQDEKLTWKPQLGRQPLL